MGLGTGLVLPKLEGINGLPTSMHCGDMERQDGQDHLYIVFVVVLLRIDNLPDPQAFCRHGLCFC